MLKLNFYPIIFERIPFRSLLVCAVMTLVAVTQFVNDSNATVNLMEYSSFNPAEGLVTVFNAPAYPGCNDPAAVNYDPGATFDDGSCQYPISSCGPDTYSYCYNNNEFIRFYYEASSGNDLYILLNGGQVQGGADFFFIWDNFNGIGSPLYTVSGPLHAGTIIHSSTGELMVQIISGPSISCNDQGYDPVNYTVRCAPPVANGLCANAQMLSTPQYPAVSNALGTIWFAEISGGSVCAGTGGPDAFYSFNVDAENHYFINVNPIGGFDAVVQVIEGCSGNEVACIDNGGDGASESELLLNLSPGNYIVRVHNASGAIETQASGNFMINVQSFPTAQVQANPANFLYACNTTDRQLEDIVGASPQSGQLSGILDYEWYIERVGGGFSNVWQRGAPNYSTKLTWLNMQYGETYNVYVRLLLNIPGQGPVWGVHQILGGLNPQDADASTCTITTSSSVTQTEVRPPYTPTNLQGNAYAMCNVTTAFTVADAENYEWEFDNGVDPAVYYIRGAGNPHVKLSWVNCLKPNNTYMTRVRAQVNGQWGTFGNAHPLDMAPTANTALRANICGTTLALTQFLLPNPVCIADSYAYELVNTITSDVHTATSTNAAGSVLLNTVSPALVPGATYSVRVKATQCGEEGDYSSACNITIAGPQIQADEVPTLRNMEVKAATAMLYPNPNAGSEVRLELDGLGDGNHEVMIQVYDVYGKLIQTDGFGHTGSAMSRLVRLDGNMAMGMYMVQIVVDGERFATERLVIK